MLTSFCFVLLTKSVVSLFWMTLQCIQKTMQLVLLTVAYWLNSIRLDLPRDMVYCGTCGNYGFNCWEWTQHPAMLARHTIMTTHALSMPWLYATKKKNEKVFSLLKYLPANGSPTNCVCFTLRSAIKGHYCLRTSYLTGWRKRLLMHSWKQAKVSLIPLNAIWCDIATYWVSLRWAWFIYT